jgi:hypothetical protein
MLLKSKILTAKRLIVSYAFKTFGFNKQVLQGAYCSFLKSLQDFNKPSGDNQGQSPCMLVVVFT